MITKVINSFKKWIPPIVAWVTATGLIYRLFLLTFNEETTLRDPSVPGVNKLPAPASKDSDFFKRIKQFRRDLKGKPPRSTTLKVEDIFPLVADIPQSIALSTEWHFDDGESSSSSSRSPPKPALRLDPFFLCTPSTPVELATVDYNALLLEHAHFSAAPTAVQSLAGEFFALPDLLLDPVIALLRAPSTGSFAASEPRSGGLSRRIFELDLDLTERSRSLESFTENLIRLEVRFFSRFQGSYLNTPAYEEGLDDLSMGALGQEQGRLVFQALKRTFLSRYRISQMSDRLRDDGLNLDEWRSWDFVVLPPALAGYTYMYGFERKFSLGDLRFRFRMDSIHRFARFDEDDRDLHSGAALLMETPWPPISLIVSCGLYDSKLELDFVGIGTDFEIVRKCLKMQN